MGTMKDPEFLADTKKSQLSVSPTSGEEMQQIVKETYALPPAILDKVRQTLSD
jgi:hypothetical protein